MSYFDLRENRLYARVVYDGATGSGKTANLLSLARLFAGPQDTEVYSPDEVAGRTLSLDWLEIHAGVVAGMPLLCQIVAVPGLAAFRERRLAILRDADVVVHVCQSRAAELDALRADLSRVRAKANVPVVVQANHQDLPDAVSAIEVARALGLEPSNVVDAIASTGVGVVDTFVAAVRVLSRELSERHEGSRRVKIGRPLSRGATTAVVARIPAERDGVAELYLRAAAQEMPTAAQEMPAGDEKRAPALPVFPDDTVATGLVWPADTARAVLRRLTERGLGEARPRATAGRTFVHTAHDFVLETRPERRYETAESAKAALVAEARACTQIESLLVDGTVLAAKESRDGAVWIWTARPEIPHLAAALDPAVTERRTHLEAYGTALATAMRVATQHGIGFDLRLASFGLQNGSVRYFGPLLSASATTVGLSVALGELDEDDTSVVLSAFEREGKRARAREDDRAERAARDHASFTNEAGTR